MKKMIMMLSFPLLFVLGACQMNAENVAEEPETRETEIEEVKVEAESEEAEMEEESVVPGVEVFLEEHLDWIEDERVGLVTNNTGIDRELNSTVDLLNEDPDINLTALYGPEHGVRGNEEAGGYVESYIDEPTGLPVYSLYGPTWKPSEEMLENVDVLIYDIQDIGSNVYTYIYTLGFVMEAAAEQDKSVIVLDRPNAIGGERVEGPLRTADTVSFMGRYLLPVRHGMTAGELATMWNHEYSLGVDLRVAEMEGWKRDMHFEDTNLPWVLTSPNIPTPDSATLYTGTILVANSTLSEGLGTTKPFEFIGAPWIDAEALETEMREKDLDGVNFRTQYFTPMFGAYEGEMVAGVQVHIEDASEINVVELGLELATAMRDQNPEEYEINDVYHELIGSTLARDMLRDGASAQEIIQEWQDDLDTWIREVRNNYLLYGDYPEDVEKYEQQPVLGILPHDLNLSPGEETSISLQGFDEDGNQIDVNWEDIEWDLANDIVEIEDGIVTAIDEGEDVLTVQYQGMEASRPIQVSMNIIDNVNVGVHDQYTRTVIELNKTIDFDVEEADGQVIITIPFAEFSEDFESGSLQVDDSPVLEQVDYELDGETFIATLHLVEENVVVETPEYADRAVIDLVH